jgi:hypothetical protein
MTTMISESEVGAMAHFDSFVGVFWAVQEHGTAVLLLEHRCSLKEAEPYGNMLTCPHGHYEIWERWRKSVGDGRRTSVPSIIAVCEYEEWPRGRIVYDSKNTRFILYADAQILRRAALLSTICKKFRLPMDREAKWDNHYRSTRLLL